jgi:hypothetical protein
LYNKAVSAVVTAFDAYGNVATAYGGTVDFTSSDTLATLPAATKVTGGTGTVSVSFKTLGSDTLTVTDSVNSKLTATVTVAVTANALHTFAAGLEMIAAPADYTGLPLADYLSTPPTYFGTWLPVEFGYASNPTPPADAIHPGIGYWAEFSAASTLMDIGVDTSTTKEYTVSLGPGWNMIGDPYATSISLNTNAQVTLGSGAVETFTKASTSIISPILYTYQAGDTNYEASTPSLAPYEGYWIYTSAACKLTMSATAL